MPLAVGQGGVLEPPEQPNYHAKEGDDFEGWALFTDGGTHSTDGENTAGWGAVARLPHGLYVMFGLVVTTEAHLACSGARNHTNNTAELSRKVGALAFLGPACPVTRRSRACFFKESQHAANMRTGMIQTRMNVPLVLTSQQLLLFGWAAFHHATFLQEAIQVLSDVGLFAVRHLQLIVFGLTGSSVASRCTLFVSTLHLRVSH